METDYTDDSGTPVSLDSIMFLRQLLDQAIIEIETNDNVSESSFNQGEQSSVSDIDVGNKPDELLNSEIELFSQHQPKRLAKSASGEVKLHRLGTPHLPPATKLRAKPNVLHTFVMKKPVIIEEITIDTAISGMSAMKADRNLLINEQQKTDQHDTNGASNGAKSVTAPLKADVPVKTDERDILAKFFELCGGTKWKSSGWSKKKTLDTWFGVTVSADHRVVGLALPGNNITELTKLDCLNLNRNNLTGSIPPELGALCNLTRLNLGMNSLQGTLELPVLQIVVRLRAEKRDNCTLFGKVDQQFFELPKNMGSLDTNIDTLDLQNCSLKVGKSAKSSILICACGIAATTARLVGCDAITGEIPSSIGSLTNLTTLDLSCNNLSGVVPESLGRLQYLQRLCLNENRLEGPIPSTLGMLRELTHLSMAQNQLIGNIPDSLGDLPSIVCIELSNNNLSGKIPEILGTVTTLEQLILVDNHLVGPVPKSLRRSKTLKNLSVDAAVSTDPPSGCCTVS